MRGEIAASAEKHRMAERQEAREAGKQIERADEQRKAKRLHDEERIDQPGDRRDRQRHRHDSEQYRIAARGAHAARPNRPDGRAISTSAMMTKTTVLDASA